VKLPAALRFVEEIPKGPTGKTLKRVLRERARTAVHAATPKETGVTRDEAKRWLDAWLLANLDSPPVPGINHCSVLADLGMDSYMAIRLADELSDWLGYEVEVTAVWNFPTTEALAEHLAARANGVRREEGNDIINLSDEAAEMALLAEL
jgi:acyl carrier protein